MVNPFEINEAFDMFFTDTVSFTCERTATTRDGKQKNAFTATVRAVVFPIEDVNPFLDTDVDTDVKQANILVKKSDWNFDFKIQTGDTVLLEDNTTYRVATIKNEQNWWKVNVRSVK